MRMHGEVDVRAVLPSIPVPTLVMHRAGDQFIDIRHSRYLADHIPGARIVELPGRRGALVRARAEPQLDEIEEFLTGARHRAGPRADPRDRDVLRHRRLDRRAAELGDRRWRDLLESIEASSGAS